jgi:hypothetical protein
MRTCTTAILTTFKLPHELSATQFRNSRVRTFLNAFFCSQYSWLRNCGESHGGMVLIQWVDWHQTKAVGYHRIPENSDVFRQLHSWWVLALFLGVAPFKAGNQKHVVFCLPQDRFRDKRIKAKKMQPAARPNLHSKTLSIKPMSES